MKNYWGLIGQNGTVDSLRGAAESNRVGNAYLFHGGEGSGKKTLAKNFAKAVNCAEKEEGKKPCGSCSSCRKFDSGNHPNFDWIRPDGASIKIKQIQQIVGEVAKKPYDSGYKVVVLEHAEKMTIDAQNAFLKTLEEPPPYTVFILLAENPKALLVTVVSRCQSFRMKPVPILDIQGYLNIRYPDRGDQIKLASGFSNGIIGRSVQMLEQPDYFEKRKSTGTLFYEIVTGKQAIGGDFDFYKNRNEAEWFVELALSILRDTLIFSEMKDLGRDEILNRDLMHRIEALSERVQVSKLLRMTDVLRRTGAYLKANVNIKGSMDAMLLNILEVTNG